MKQLYSIYDLKARVYTAPVAIGHDEEATRMFADLCSDKNTPQGKHPEDYVLWNVGRWDQTTGAIHQEKSYVVISGTAATIKEMK